MKPRLVPVYPFALVVEDDEVASVRGAQAVAQRAAILWAIVLRAEGLGRAEVEVLLRHLELEPHLSDEEREFLSQSETDPDEAQWLEWRLESLWVLLWALGHLDELPWPSQMCDVARIVGIMKVNEADPSFIEQARLRPIAELLDAQELTMRINWAIRNASMYQQGWIPSGLDWSAERSFVHVTEAHAAAVVEQRHHTLNWLLDLDEADWDCVSTPT